MKHFAILVGCVAVAGSILVGARAAESPRSEVRFDSDWRFNRGDIPAAPAANFTGPFDSRSPSGTAQGFTLGDVAWYRKDFVLPNSARSKNLMVTFDGVYMNSTVWFNGHQVASQPYGYTTFHVDLTRYARIGGRNALAVRVDTTGRTSRWYSGSGIYRHVWLTTTNAAHIAPWGVAATSHQETNGSVSVHAAVQLAPGVSGNATVAVALIDPGCKTVQSATANPNADPYRGMRPAPCVG